MSARRVIPSFFCLNITAGIIYLLSYSNLSKIDFSAYKKAKNHIINRNTNKEGQKRGINDCPDNKGNGR